MICFSDEEAAALLPALAEVIEGDEGAAHVYRRVAAGDCRPEAAPGVRSASAKLAAELERRAAVLRAAMERLEGNRAELPAAVAD